MIEDLKKLQDSGIFFKCHYSVKINTHQTFRISYKLSHLRNS